jgi:DNA-binding winged helix-turn-helix (wHTH) protein/TolB-like protein
MGQSSWMDAGFVLGDWLVRPRHGTLERRATASTDPAQLEPRVMAVLVCLARRAGQVVTRDEFIAEVWSGRAVSDEALSRCISVLRQSLGDDPHEPRYIRTIAKVGYTLLCPPEPLPAAEPVPPAESAPAPAALSARPRVRLRSTFFWVGGAAVVAAAGLAAYWLRTREPPTPEPPPPVTRLAVLPFDTREARDFGRDVGNELAEEISDSLVHVQRLRISGRATANAIAAEGRGAIAAAHKLGVDALLEGAVAQSTEGLRVSTRLIATSDRHLQWSKVYELKPAEIFAAQRSIAAAVVRALGVSGSDEPSGVEPDSRDLQAYQLYLRGAHQVRLRGEDSLRLAVDLFAAAARRDPGYARAQVGLATAYVLLPSYTFEDPADMYALADKALATAERLSGSRSTTAGVRAYLAFQRWHWIEAETAFRTAITAEPNNPDVRQLYSQLLGVAGRLDRALQQARVAQELDPLAPVVADRIGVLCLWRGEDAEAARNVALAHELGLEESAYPETKVILRLHEHADAQAIEILRDLQRTLNRSEAWIEPTIGAIRHAEQRPAAIEMLGRAQRAGAISPRIYFGAMVLLGSPARAMHAFEALIDRDPNDLEFLFSSDAAAVRRDPAFGPFVEKMGLVAYWDRFGWSSACRRDAKRIVCH